MKLITIKNFTTGHLVVVTLVFQVPSTCKIFKAPSTCSYLCVLDTINFRIPLYFKYYQLEDTFVFKALSISGYLCISNAINLKIPLFLYLSCYQYAGTFFFGPLYLWCFILPADRKKDQAYFLVFCSLKMYTISFAI